MYKLVQNVLNLGLYSKCVRLVQLMNAKFVSYATTYWQSYRSGNKPTLLQILYQMHLFTCCEVWKCLSAVCIFNGKVLFSLNCIHKRNFRSPKLCRHQFAILGVVGLPFFLFRYSTGWALKPSLYHLPNLTNLKFAVPQISNKPSTE